MDIGNFLSATFNGWWIVWAILGLSAARYIFLAGMAYLLCYYPGVKNLRRYKIQPGAPKRKQLRNELKYSLSTILIFSGVGIVAWWLYTRGYTTLYSQVNEQGVGYLFLSLIAMILVHDTYFYWTHRLLHTKWLFKKIHTVHHRSVNPTPWAAYSFHPVEALVESLVIFPFITLFPVHYLVFGLFTFLVLFMNVVGHLGFEFIPRRLRFSSLGKFLTSSTHHNMHHQKTKKNFGFYFTFWDRFMRTLQEENSGVTANPSTTGRIKYPQVKPDPAENPQYPAPTGF